MQAFVHAPDFDAPGVVPLNLDRPLRLADLAGRIVVLDFWTYGCINCLHVIPTLREIEAAFADEVVVVGVHSPKFAAERDDRGARHAIARYDISHPVLHDPDRALWERYAVRAWPTLVVIAPDGKEIARMAGEPHRARFLRMIAELVREFREHGDLAPRPAPPISDHGQAERFLYPAKIKPLPGDAPCWALADSGHHQIVILDDDGRELRRIGSGAAGLDDGAASQASFDRPQGLVCDRGAIFVADTGNHAIRRIDLAADRVRTIAGNGERGGRLGGREPARAALLASPWDLALDRDRLYVANAGTHQIGVIDLAAKTLARLAGDGRENIVDGPAATAQLAQPSGLVLDGPRTSLYFADSESSAVRVVRLGAEPLVETLVGLGLFTFGHRNGSFEEALFQHPLAVATNGDSLLVADSYNGRLRSLSLDDAVVNDFGDGFLCRDPLCLPLDEPAGIWADSDRVLVVDTNNHRVLQFVPHDRHYATWAS